VVKIAESAEDWTIRHEREWAELIGSVKDAGWFSPLDWPRSVLGNLSSFRPAPNSEYNLLWSANIHRLTRYLGDVLVPSVPVRAPSWLHAPVSSLFFHRSRELKDAGRAPPAPFEQWFFINGILANQDVALMNASYLADLFGRPITALWNSTDGAGIDLVECTTEKLGATSEDVDRDFHLLLDAIAHPANRRVVVISHSQGTLITAVLLRLIGGVYRHTMTGRERNLSASDRESIRRHAAAHGLEIKPERLKPVTPTELGKLEVYCFANCASQMNYVDPDLALPKIESFGNEHDLVARLGMLAPHPNERKIEIAGPRFRHNGAWGHLLNAHYLINIDRAQRQRTQAGDAPPGTAPYVLIKGTAPAGTVPRLFHYLDGGGAIS